MDANRLKQLPVFAPLDDDTLRRIATYATERSAGAGETLVREGDYAEEFMVIEEGEARVERGGQEIAMLGPGDVFGEIAVVEKGLRNATVRATAPVRLVVLSHWDLKRIGSALDTIKATMAERKRVAPAP